CHHAKNARTTYPRPASEWIVRKLRDALSEPILPAFGTKLFGLRKIPGIAVVHPLAHQYGIPPLHPVSPKFQVVCRLSPDHVDGRVQPHGLSNYGSRGGMTMKLIGGRSRTSKNRLPFRHQLIFNIRVLREQIPAPSERQGGRLVPGEIKRHRLVAKL